MNKTFAEQMKDVLIGLGVSDIDKLNVTEIKELYFDMVYKSDEEGFMNPGEIEKELFSPENSLMQGAIDDKQYKKIKELESPLLEVIEDKYGQAAADSLTAFRDRTGYVESGNDYGAIQMEGGPGRGRFQYETGEDQAGETAVRPGFGCSFCRGCLVGFPLGWME